MVGILTGFVIIGFVIAVGWVLARTGVVLQEHRIVLNKVAFFAASPALLFTVLARSDVQVVFTKTLAVHTTTVLIVGAFTVPALRFAGGRGRAELLMHTHTAFYSNANNIGLPVAVHVIGDAQYVAPLLFLQLVIIAPLLMGAMDVLTSGGSSLRQTLAGPFRNPIVIGALGGAIVAALGWKVPALIMQPLELLGGAAVPLMLLAFGISLDGQRPLQAGTPRRATVVATVMKAFVMPLVAWLVASLVFGLDGRLTYAAVVLAALPTAQNMYQYALRYRTGEVVARDVILLTTMLSVPVTLVIALLLHP